MALLAHAMLMVIGIQINYTLFGGLRAAIWTEKVEDQPMARLQNDELGRYMYFRRFISVNFLRDRCKT